jgi:hypothetical protein
MYKNLKRRFLVWYWKAVMANAHRDYWYIRHSYNCGDKLFSEIQPVSASNAKFKYNYAVNKLLRLGEDVEHLRMVDF